MGWRYIEAQPLWAVDKHLYLAVPFLYPIAHLQS